MIVDDDELSRLIIKNYIVRTNFLKLIHEFDSAKKAKDILLGESANEVDIVFLDVEMPEMSGMTLIKSLQSAYNVVIMSGNKKYAIEAFEDSVADYLIKPVEYNRFLKSTEKVQKILEKNKLIAEKEDHIYIKSGGKLIRVQYQNILFIEALADYVIFHTNQSKHIVHHTMKGIQKKLPESIFSRIHRGYIINREQISKIEDLHVFINTLPIPIGASYKDHLISKLNML